MKILIVSATIFEMAPLMQHLEQNAKSVSFFEFQNSKHNIFPVVTGVGSVNTALGISKFTHIKDMDVVINMGVAGSFDRSIELGTVVEIIKDRFGDLGVEESDGSFTDVHELDLIGQNYYPFSNGWLNSDKQKLNFNLPHKSAITVNKVHGTQSSIDKVMDKYNADTESMEGAAFMFTCKSMDVKFHQIRAISNYVEPRNKENWKLNLAIDNLNAEIIKAIN
jgi:futalosine hydrolase